MKIIRKCIMTLSIASLILGMSSVDSFAISTTIDGATATATSGYTNTVASASTVYPRVAYKYVDVIGVYREGNTIYNTSMASDSNGGVSNVDASVTVSGHVLQGVYAHHTVTYGNNSWNPTTQSGLQPAK